MCRCRTWSNGFQWGLVLSGGQVDGKTVSAHLTPLISIDFFLQPVRTWLQYKLLSPAKSFMNEKHKNNVVKLDLYLWSVWRTAYIPPSHTLSAKFSCNTQLSWKLEKSENVLVLQVRNSEICWKLKENLKMWDTFTCPPRGLRNIYLTLCDMPEVLGPDQDEQVWKKDRQMDGFFYTEF